MERSRTKTVSMPFGYSNVNILIRWARRLSCLLLMACYPQCAALAQTVAISAAPASGLIGGTTSFNISISTAGGAQPVALQWTMGYSTTDISSLSVTVAGTASTAAKTISCGNGTGTTTCLLYGMSPAVIASGVVAQVTANLSPTSTAASTAIQITAASASDQSPKYHRRNGYREPDHTSERRLQELTGLTCSPGSINVAGSISCTVSLSGQALTAGFPVALSQQQ